LVKNRQFASSKPLSSMLYWRWIREGEGKEVSEMLSLEIIGVLAALFAFLVYGMVRTQLAKREAEAKQAAEKGAPATAQKAR
jgi:hypothetical protein